MQNSFDAVAIAADWLRGAQERIDTAFGPEYARKNPSLVQMFIRVAADAYIARHAS